ncbi:MAG: UDP-N-acetylmuramate dehydrogenase [bacterium]|nr:UDP-N-acetylmuramate dehydrogenase [bacterium]
MVWQKNINLASFTTFQIGGPADYFYEAKNSEEVIEAVKEAKSNNWPIFVLAGGSNILISDEGFRGAVIKIRNVELGITKQNSSFQIICDAGVLLSKLVAQSLKVGAAGLEWAIGIPGTVGGAIVGNSGAYRHSISESVKEVEVLDLITLTKKVYASSDCQFQYRESTFKKNNKIVLSVVLELQKNDGHNNSELIKKYLEQRKGKIPPYPSAGSVFKNIEVKNISSEVLKNIPSEIIKAGKLPAGYLIEQCGLKGHKINGAEISNQHANFIINAGGAKAEDVYQLMRLCQKSVKEKFGIELESEIRLIGFEARK